jgi:hypothetical protein
MVRPADEDFHDERTSFMMEMYESLPYDAVYERWISSANTQDWWLKAHRQSEKEVKDYKNFSREIDYHTRFQGYCPRCQKGG